MTHGLGDEFQIATKYVRDRMDSHSLDWAAQPETHKTYPDAVRIALDTPRLKGGASLWAVIKERQSVRLFGQQPIAAMELSRILWASQGVTHRSGEYAFRAAPSAGALYPVETYLAVHRVDGIEPGIYHYAVLDHELEQLETGDSALLTARAALDQRVALEAAVVLIWTGVFGRAKWKYRQRAYRYVYLDAGHIAENAALSAVGLGLGSCQIAAIYDDEANALLGVDGEHESVIYMTAIGHPR